MAGGLRDFRKKLIALVTLLLVALVGVVLYFKVIVWPGNRVAVVYFEEARNVGLSTAVTLEGDGPKIGKVRHITRRSDLNRVVVSRIDAETFKPLLLPQRSSPQPDPRILDWHIDVPATGRTRLTVWFMDHRSGTADAASNAETPVVVGLACGQDVAGAATPDPSKSDRWEAKLELEGLRLAADPCLLPIAVALGTTAPWLRPEPIRLEGEYLFLQIRAAALGEGAAGGTLMVRDGAGGDLERVAFTADPHPTGLLTARIRWADRALTAVDPGNDRLEVRPPARLFTFYAPATVATASLCGYDELAIDHSHEAHAPPALALVADEAGCPSKPMRSLLEPLTRGTARLIPFAGRQLLITWYNPPVSRRMLQEVELEIEPSTSGVDPGADPEHWPFGFVPADTVARVSSQFGLRAPVMQIIPGDGDLYMAQRVDPKNADDRLLVQGAQEYSEDVSAIWALLTDSSRVGLTAPANRIEAMTLAGFDLVRGAHRLSTRLEQFADSAADRIDAADFDLARDLGGRAQQALDQALALLTRFGALAEPLSPATTRDVTAMLHDLRRITAELEPLTRALAAPDEAALEQAPLLIRQAGESLERLNSMLEKTGDLFKKAEALSAQLETGLGGTDLKALGLELRTLLEQTKRILRETEVLEYRLNRTWPLKKKPTPPPVTVEAPTPATVDAPGPATVDPSGASDRP